MGKILRTNVVMFATVSYYNFLNTDLDILNNWYMSNSKIIFICDAQSERACWINNMDVVENVSASKIYIYIYIFDITFVLYQQ